MCALNINATCNHFRAYMKGLLTNAISVDEVDADHLSLPSILSENDATFMP